MANMQPRYVRKNVVRGQAQVWYRPYDVSAALPSNEMPLGGDWTSTTGTNGGHADWTPIGATEGGVTMRFTRETNDISVEEQPNPLDVATNTLDPRIEATLAEDTLNTMKLAYGGGTIISTAPTPTTSGVREYKISNELEHLTLGLEGMNHEGYWRRVLLQDVLSVAEVETAFRRSETQRLYAVSFRIVSPVEDMIIREKFAAPTA